MEVGEWTEGGNINRGKIMEKDPVRAPQGAVHEVGVLLAKKDPLTPISATILHLDGKARNTTNNNTGEKKGQQNYK